MKLKRYCVTVMDNWTPTREFWTLAGAKRHWLKHAKSSHLFKWQDGKWMKLSYIGEYHRLRTWPVP